jgi:hypothetical protein
MVMSGQIPEQASDLFSERRNKVTQVQYCFFMMYSCP